MERCAYRTSPVIEAGCRPEPDELIFNVAYDGEWYVSYGSFHPCYPTDADVSPDAPDDPAPDIEDAGDPPSDPDPDDSDAEDVEDEG